MSETIAFDKLHWPCPLDMAKSCSLTSQTLKTGAMVKV